MADQVLTTPKYEQTKRAIKTAIREGKFRKGQKLPSVRDLMSIYSVSYSTIARSLKELRDADVVEARWGKGIYVNGVQRKVVNIAVTFDKIFESTDDRIAGILQGIERSVASAQWHMHLFPLPEKRLFGGDAEHLLATLLRQQQIDALIALSPQPPEDIATLHSMDIPVVSVQNYYPGTGTACVMTDAADTARQIARYLVDELGHKRICVVLGPKHKHSARLVRSSMVLGLALAREFRARGLKLPPQSILHSDYSWKTVEPVVRAWLASPDRPTAITVSDEALTNHTVRLAREMGLKVPQDLCVLGQVDRSESTALSVIRKPVEEMGAQAVKLLERIVAGDVPSIRRIKSTLVVRQAGPSAAT